MGQKLSLKAASSNKLKTTTREWGKAHIFIADIYVIKRLVQRLLELESSYKRELGETEGNFNKRANEF